MEPDVPARSLLALLLAAFAAAPVSAVADGPGETLPGRVLPLPPTGSPFAPPLPRTGPQPDVGPMPAPAPIPPLARMLSERPKPLRDLRRGFSDGNALVLYGRPALARATIARARSAGATVVRVPMAWRAVQRLGTPVDPTNPDDPAYDFALWDALLERITRAGLEPLVTIYEAPDAYEAPGRWRYAPAGTWAPDPAALGRFATAVARRYSGAWRDPARPGGALPHVRWWQAWNEPNLGRYLQPQWVARDGRWRPYSPLRYRSMLNAFSAGVKSVDPWATVVTAGTAPIGEARDGEGRMAPVRFWQALLCLGVAPRIAVHVCPDPAHFDVLSHHPLSISNPTRVSAGPLDVAIADFQRIARLLRVAQRHRLVVPAGGQRLAVTELNWDSAPDSPRGVPARRMVPFISSALYLLWRQGVDMVLWQIVRDPVPGGGRVHPAGLYRIDPQRPFDPGRDRAKPALRAFRMPFVAVRTSRSAVRVWGLLTHGGHRSAAVERRKGARWDPVARLRADRAGTVWATVALRGRARLRLVDAATGAASAAWVVRARRDLVPRP
jgi:hypothetical protein